MLSFGRDDWLRVVLVDRNDNRRKTRFSKESESETCPVVSERRLNTWTLPDARAGLGAIRILRALAGGEENQGDKGKGDGFHLCGWLAFLA